MNLSEIVPFGEPSDRIKNVLDKFVQWHKKKYSQPEKTFSALFLSSIFILIFIPGIPFLFYKDLDKNFTIPQMVTYPLNLYLGLPIALLGFFLFAWTIGLFLKVGKGTQVPVMPTQKLIIVGPYSFTRNPMVLGVIIWVIGLGVLINSFSFMVIGLINPLLYLVYIKLVEEKELETRFTKDYLEYKRKTSFLLPNIFKNK